MILPLNIALARLLVECCSSVVHTIKKEIEKLEKSAEKSHKNGSKAGEKALQ